MKADGERSPKGAGHVDSDDINPLWPPTASIVPEVGPFGPGYFCRWDTHW